MRNRNHALPGPGLGLFAVLIALTGCRSVPGEGADGALALELEALRARYPGTTVAVSYRDLGGARTVDLDADVVLHAASTMKVPVMIEVFRQAASGTFGLDDGIPVTATFRSIVDGSPYTLSAASDSETGLYARTGERVAIRELVRLMIVRSSNLATNMLVDLVGARNIQRTMESLGTTRMKVLRGVEDQKAYDAGLSNVTTARDLAEVLAAIADGRAATPAHAREMLEILRAQEFNEMIPAGLPEEVRPGVAHKTGWITAIHHDAAIVEAPGVPTFVLVVLTRGFRESAESAAVVAEVAACVWKHHVSGR